METKIETRGEKYILKIGTSHFNTEITGIAEADLIKLKEQIEKTLNKETKKVTIWNPRAQRHEIVNL